MADDKKLVHFQEDDGQLSFLDPEENYYPATTDYAKIPTPFVENFGNISYLADLGLVFAITTVEKRNREMFKGTQEGMFLEEAFKKIGTDFTDGLVAEFPINKFIKTFNLSSAGRTYQTIDALFNGLLLRNQWQILYEDKDIIGSTAVVIGTMYSKKTNKMYMKFNPDLESVITNIKNNYARISLPVLGKLKDDFASKLYQVLKRRLDFEIDKCKKYGMPEPKEVPIFFDLDKFYFEMGIYPLDLASDDKNMQKVVYLLQNKNYKMAAEIEHESGLIDEYENKEKGIEGKSSKGVSRKRALNDFNYFRRVCLDKAFRRINGFVKPKHLEKVGSKPSGEAYEEYEKNCVSFYPTDIHFRYEVVRAGIGGKASGICLYTSKGQWKEEIIDIPYAEIKEPPRDDVAFVIEMKNFITEQVSAKEIMTIAETADWNIDRIKKAYAVACEQHPDDFVAFMISAIKNDWNPGTATDVTEKEKKGYTVEQFKEKFEFDIYSEIEDDPEFVSTMENFIEIMVEFINSDKKTVRISRSNIEAEKVKERLLELKGEHICAAVNAFLKAKPKTVTENYILTILYNIKQQENLRQAQKAHAARSRKEKPAEEYSMEFIKEHLKYDDISLMGEKYQKEIDSIFNYIYDALNTDEQQIKIGKGNMPAQAVKSRLLKLEPFDVITATKQIISSGRADIVTKTYILTVLYQIHDQESLGLAKQLQEDAGIYTE